MRRERGGGRAPSGEPVGVRASVRWPNGFAPPARAPCRSTAESSPTLVASCETCAPPSARTARSSAGSASHPWRNLFADAGAAARGVLITSPGLTPDRLGASGKRFVRRFGATQPGGRVTAFDVYAAAATELLDAIARSDGTRASVVRALSETRLPDSVLGPLALAGNGEPLVQPITVLRDGHGRGRADIVQGLDGAVAVDVITPPARLVGMSGSPPELGVNPPRR
jgi:hypothetical protein